MLTALIGTLTFGSGFATDLKREAEIAEQLAKTPVEGKSIQLEASGNKFLSLYNETEKLKSQGTVILLHDREGHPNQKNMIFTLRTYLPDHNWSTLSLQMPLRESGSQEQEYFALLPEAHARIQAAVNYLKENSTETIVILGYGLGSLMALYSQSEQETDIAALITISLPVPETEAKTAQTIDFIKKIKTPMLDVYGSLDQPGVVSNARNRRLAAKNNANFRQLMMENEEHSYDHDQELVAKRIYSWLTKTVIQKK